MTGVARMDPPDQQNLFESVYAVAVNVCYTRALSPMQQVRIAL